MSLNSTDHRHFGNPHIRFAFLTLVFCAAACAAAVSPSILQAAPPAAAIIGNWQGTLTVDGRLFHAVVHFTQAKDGALTGTGDSPDEGQTGIPLENLSYKAPTLYFEYPSNPRGSYTGTYIKAKGEITGQWAQGDQKQPLNFTRAK